MSPFHWVLELCQLPDALWGPLSFNFRARSTKRASNEKN